MAKVIADELDGDLDVVLVRKLRAPRHAEFAIGSVDESGWVYLADYASSVGATQQYIDAEISTQLEVMRQRRVQYTPVRPPVEYYVQSKNTYRTSTTWPPTGTTLSRLALEPGALVPDGSRPSKPTTTQQYVSNPAAGFSMAFNRYGTVAASPYVPTDQRLEGPQGLTFRTAPQQAALPLAGPLALHLVASSDATDTDWYAKVSDVAPDGTETFVTEGALRASHRALDAAKSTPARPYHPHTNPQPVVPGRFYDYDVEIWPTAYELAAGHRLQLRLTSSDLPTHLPGTIVLDRDNPTTARVDLLPPATNTIRMSQSFLTLSVTGAPASTAPAPAAVPRSAPTGSLAATGPGPLLPAAALLLLLMVAVVARRRSVR